MNDINMNDSKVAFFTSLVKGKKVLDLGVVQHQREKYNNKTWLHRAICQFSKETLGLDIDEEGIAFLRGKGYNVVCADAQDFHLAQKFDVVVAGDIIEHLDNFAGFLQSVKEHMKPDGILAISTPNPFWWRTVIKVLVFGKASPHPQHTCWFCEDTIRQLLGRYDFVIKRIEYGSIYSEDTIWQKITRLVNPLMFLPKALKHNTLMIVAKLG